MSIRETLERYGCCIISHGTLKLEDLLPKYYVAALELAPHEVEKRASFPPADDAWYDTDEAGFLLDELEETLKHHAPEGFYFGGSGDDGSEFGFWRAIDD